MSSAIQNRLVGTIIIVALAVIFLPDILDGKKQTNQAQFEVLPDRPAMGPVVEAKPFPVDQVRSNVTIAEPMVDESVVDDIPKRDTEDFQPSSAGAIADTQQDVAAQKTQPTAEEIDRPVEDPQGDGPQVVTPRVQEPQLERAGWVVQLGVFRHQKNVRELLTTLRNAGYRAFSRPVETQSGTLTKVFVGPDLDKKNLEKALPHLQELTKLQGRITPFTVK